MVYWQKTANIVRNIETAVKEMIPGVYAADVQEIWVNALQLSTAEKQNLFWNWLVL